MDHDDEKRVQEQKNESNREEEEALRERDWELWRELSLKPGGFGEERISAWSILVHAIATRAEESNLDESLRSTMRRRKSSVATGQELESDPSVTHPDEHQIKLDTDRSFVLYPSEEQRDRTELQSDLNNLITSIFRKHPRLNYFQGYHDIVTVIYLTLPESNRLRVCEKLSLHRLRDAMGTGLEPVIALLRILKFLLRLADRSFSELLERNTPLPYFALSNLLTLFSHDVPTLPLIQHVFDYLLCRPPIMSVYLAAAITLARKDEAQLLETEGEDGMLHSLLSSLPDVVDENPESSADETLDRKTEESSFASRIINTVDNEEFSSDEGNQSSFTHGTPRGELNKVVEALEPFEEKSAVILHPEAEEREADQDSPQVDQPLNNSEMDAENSTDHSSPSTPVDSQPRAKRKTIYLPQILREADGLFMRYPPSHPDLHLSSILGPRSVVFTWSENQADLLTDDEAEAIVSHPELIVLPFEDPDEMGYHERRKEGKSVPSQKHAHRGRQLLPNSKTMMLTGVAVAGIAVVAYSLKSRGSRGRVDELKKAGQWLADIFNAQVYPF